MDERGPLLSAKTDQTKLQIIRAAEALFFERGFEAVSMREVAIAARQGNPSAAIYHFGDKRGLVNAILDRHAIPIQTGWLATLRYFDTRGVTALEDLASLLVRPIVDKIDDPEGGRAYLALCAELATSSSIPLSETRACQGPGVLEMSRCMMAAAGPMDPALLMLRKARIETLIFTSIHDYMILLRRGLSVSREAFTADLIDAVTVIANPRRPLAPPKPEPANPAPRKVAVPAKKTARKK